MAQVRCPTCNEATELGPAEETAVVCPRCGAVLQAPAVVQPIALGYAAVRTRQSKGLAIAAFVLGILALAPCVGLPCLLASTVMGIVVLATKRPGKGFAIAGPVIGWAALVMTGLCFFSFSSPRPPTRVAVTRPSGRGAWGRRSICPHHLDQVGRAIDLYLRDHGGTYPPDLNALAASGYLTPVKLKCPASSSPARVNYFYIQRPPLPSGAAGTRSLASTSTTILACDYKGNHRTVPTTRNVLFVNGHIATLDEPDFRHLLTRAENAAFAAALRAIEGR